MSAAIIVLTARAPPRVKPEAEENYMKNRGTLGMVLDQSKNRNYADPRPVPRCPTAESQEQYERHRGKMNLFLDQSKNKGYMSARPVPRCPSPEAKAQYDKHRGCMEDMLGAKSGYSAPVQDRRLAPRCVKPEAQGIAKMNKGTATKSLFENYGNLPQSARPVPRIKPEADDNMRKNTGCMNNLLGQYGRHPLSARPIPKVKPEGEDNARLNQGSRAKMMLSMAPPTHRTSRGNPSRKNLTSSCVF